MNLNQAKQVITRTHMAALTLGVRANSIEMRSGPGIGKSSIMVEACAELARQLNEPVGLTIEMLATLQSVDVRGFMLPAKSATGGLDTVFSTPPWYPVRANVLVFLPDGTRYLKGEWDGAIPRVGVCGLDELGQAEQDVQKAAAELILHGQVGTTRLPTGWRVIAASNRLSDRAGVMKSLTFLTNRRLEIAVDADLGTWQDWVNLLPEGQRPHHLTVSFASKEPALVFRDAVPPGEGPFCTPRTLVLMDRDLQALRSPEDIKGDKLPTDGIAREVCAGWIGGGEAAQFFTHIRFAEVLPDIEDIERNPATAKLPAQRDGQMVCSFFIAHHLNEKNASKIMQYIDRLGVDMQVLAVRTITARIERAKILADVPEYTPWLLRHKDVMIASQS